jgi:hypothetical protein
MNIYQISRYEVVCFAFHDDLLFLDYISGKKRIINVIPMESSVFFGSKKNHMPERDAHQKTSSGSGRDFRIKQERLDHPTD